MGEYQPDGGYALHVVERILEPRIGDIEIGNAGQIGGAQLLEESDHSCHAWIV
jgi:hypothetical protein